MRSPSTIGISLQFLLALLLLIITFHVDTVESYAVNNDGEKEDTEIKPPSLWGNYNLLEVLPHDPSAFTQGLTSYNGKLYESIGLYGKSQLREINPTDGSVLSSHALDHQYFAEGLTYFQDVHGNHRLLQLTWKAKIGFIYDATSFHLVKEFTYDTQTGEGWGITFDPETKMLIVSDGSEWLHFWDSETLEEVKRIRVMIGQSNPRTKETMFNPVNYLNELEFVNGRVLANVWYQDVMVSIDPNTGTVDRLIDFKDLYKNRDSQADCFNGIAQWGDEPGELLVTGKLWPKMYRIKLM